MVPVVIVATFIPCICVLIIFNMAIHMKDISNEDHFLWRDNSKTRLVRDINCFVSFVFMITIMIIRLSASSASEDDLLDNMMCQMLAMCSLIVSLYTVAVRHLRFELYRSSQVNNKKGEKTTQNDELATDSDISLVPHMRFAFYRDVIYEFIPPYILCIGILVFVKLMRMNIRCETCEIRAMMDYLESSKFNVTFPFPGSNNATVIQLTEEWKDVIIYNDPLSRGFVLAVNSFEIVVFGMISCFLIYFVFLAIPSIKGARIQVTDWFIQVISLFIISTAAFFYRVRLVHSFDTMPDHFIAGIIGSVTIVMSLFDFISVSYGKKNATKYIKLEEKEKQQTQTNNEVTMDV